MPKVITRSGKVKHFPYTQKGKAQAMKARGAEVAEVAKTRSGRQVAVVAKRMGMKIRVR